MFGRVPGRQVGPRWTCSLGALIAASGYSAIYYSTVLAGQGHTHTGLTSWPVLRPSYLCTLRHPFCMAKRGTTRVLEYARLAMGCANVRASRYGIRSCSGGYSGGYTYSGLHCASNMVVSAGM